MTSNIRVMSLVLVLATAAGAAQGAVAETGWAAHWIQAPWSTERDGTELDGSRPMPVFRREFTVRGKPVKATLRIAGLGQYEARIGSNGEMHLAAPHGLHQAWTDYKKTVTFESYDVTRWLTPGRNVVGVMLGNGMYNVQKTKGRYTKFEGSFGVPKLIAELRVQYGDGKVETIGTEGTWKVAKGPVLFSSTYGGRILMRGGRRSAGIVRGLRTRGGRRCRRRTGRVGLWLLRLRLRCGRATSICR